MGEQTPAETTPVELTETEKKVKEMVANAYKPEIHDVVIKNQGVTVVYFGRERSN